MSGIVVLISGRGSNLAAMCNNGLATQIKCVISNKSDAYGLIIAKEFGIKTHVVDHKAYNSREEFDAQMAAIIDKLQPAYLILAGFMRILSSWFVEHYQNRLINIHPSILPAFIGSNAINQAFDAKVKITGVTIHFVTEKLDHGPIIAQGIVDTTGVSSINELADKIHAVEHIIYPFIIHKLIKGNVHIQKNDQVVVDKSPEDIKLLGELSNSIFY